MSKSRKKSSGRKKAIKEFPLEKCLITEEWQKRGIAHISVIRKTPTLRWIVGGYLVDLFCLGLKNTYVHRNLLKMQMDLYYKRILSNNDVVECSIALSRQIIYGGIDYAKNLGFSPHKDFKFSKEVLGERVLEEETYDVEFGKDGAPFFISGPKDNYKQILKILEMLEKRS